MVITYIIPIHTEQWAVRRVQLVSRTHYLLGSGAVFGEGFHHITDRAFALDAVSLSRFQHFRRLRVSAFSFSFLIHKSKQNPNDLIVQICLLTYICIYCLGSGEFLSCWIDIHNNNKHNTLMSCGLCAILCITEFPVPLTMHASYWRSFIRKFCQRSFSPLSFYYGFDGNIMYMEYG